MKMVNVMTEVKEPNLVEIMVIADIKNILKACDEDAERDFLSEFGAYRKEIVYQKEAIDADRFDELCQMVLDDLNHEDETHEKDS